MKKLILTLALELSSMASAQCYKIVNNTVTAKYKVYFTTKQSEANVYGFKADNPFDCTKPGVIFLAPVYMTNATPVHQVKSASEADLIIFWVSDRKEAKFLR